MKKNEQSQINSFVARHMRDFFMQLDYVGTPDEIAQMLRKELEQIALSSSAESIANDIVEDYVNLMNRHPELYKKTSVTEKIKDVQVIPATPCPNIISSTLREGVTLIENRHGYLDIYYAQEQRLMNKTPEEIKKELESTKRETIFLAPGEKIIVAPKEGRLGTFIDQELIDGQVTLTFQFIILPQAQLDQEKENTPQKPLENEASQEYAEM